MATEEIVEGPNGIFYLYSEMLAIGGGKEDAMTLTDGPENVRLSEAIQRRMNDYREDQQTAVHNLVHTADGQRLWEEARKERLKLSEQEGERRIVKLRPRTYTVRQFKPGEHGSQWGDCGIFDGDELIGMADLQPLDEGEAAAQHLPVKEVSFSDGEVRQALSERGMLGASGGAAQAWWRKALKDEAGKILGLRKAATLSEALTLAEQNLIRSAEGLALYESAHKECIAEKGAARF